MTPLILSNLDCHIIPCFNQKNIIVNNTYYKRFQVYEVCISDVLTAGVYPRNVRVVDHPENAQIVVGRSVAVGVMLINQ